MTDSVMTHDDRPRPLVLHRGAVRPTGTRSSGRPALRVVDGRAAPGRSTGQWAASVGELTGRSLGTDFAAAGARLAALVEHLTPSLLARGRRASWAAAIVFVLAEHIRLFEHDCCVTPASFARELGSTVPTLRRRAAVLRPVLLPHLPVVPDPDPAVEAPWS